MPDSLGDVASAATLSSVAAATSSTLLLSANNARRAVLIQNDSGASMYLAYAATASTSAYSVLIPANSYWEMPPLPVYTGPISACWSSASGNARCTEC
jgi:hypothetical protein